MAPRRQWNDGMELVFGDLSNISSSLEMELYDRLIYQLMNRQKSVVFGDSFAVTYINATTVQVAVGDGCYYDNTQVDPEPMTRLLRVATATNKTLAAADSSNNRIDLICLTPARATAASASRNTKDAGSGVVTPTSQVVETDWLSTLSVVTGTPSGSPVAPATPAGAIVLAQVLVVATTGLAGQSGITDRRTRFRKPNGWQNVLTLAATGTIDLDTDLLLVNAAGGAVVATLPTAASAYDSTTGMSKMMTVIKIDSSGNAVTVAGNGSELISDANTQAIANQYTALRMVSNGTQWYLI